MTRRVRLTVEYDGTAYSGWQRQLNAVSVQQRLEEAKKRKEGGSSSAADFAPDGEKAQLW